ncbi:MAG: caspase family protein [bacterium]
MKFLTHLIALFIVLSPFAQAQKPELVIQTGHTNGLTSAVFSRDEKYVLTGSWDNTAKLWDASTGREIRTFAGHSERIWSVAISPDGRYVATGSYDKTAKIWETSTGKELRVLTGHKDEVHSVSFSPDGQYLATGSCDKTAKLWETSTGREVKSFTGHSEDIYCLAFSPNGQYMVTGSFDKTAKLWEVSTGKEMKTFTGHSSSINSVAFSPSGRYVVTGSRDSTARLWDVSTGREVKTLARISSWINSVALSPDGMYVVIGSYNGTIKLYDISTDQEVSSFAGHPLSVTSVTFSNNGKYILSGSWDSKAKLWKASTGREVMKIAGHSSEIRTVAFSSDGRNVVMGSDSVAKIWEAMTGRGLRGLSNHSGIYSAAFSQNGRYAVTGSVVSGIARIFDVSTGREVRTLTGKWGSIYSVAFSPDDQYVVTGSMNGRVKLWDVSTGKEERTFIGHSGDVAAVAFSPDGQMILAGSTRDVKLWDASTGIEVKTLKGHSSLIRSVAFSPDGKDVVTGSADKTAKLWDISTGAEVKTLTGHSDWVNSVVFSSDGRYLVTGSWDKTAKLWEVSTGKEVRTFIGSSGGINSVAFSLNGKYIVGGCKTGECIIWDLQTGIKLASRIALDEKDWVVVTPDGRFDASANGMKLLHYVQGMEVLPLESFFEQFYTPNLFARVLSGEKIETTPTVDFSKAIKLPPLVRIVSPKTGETFTSDRAQISVEVTDQGGGIDEIRLYHNGKLISEDQRGMKVIESKTTKITKTFDVTLLPGINEFKITAFNMERTESVPVSLSIELTATEASAELYILAIGINQYKNSVLNLNYGRPDAEAFLQVAERKARGIFRAIKKYEVYDQQATKVNIEGILTQIIQLSKPQDVFLFFYAGHGVMSEGDAALKPDFYLIPSDITQLYGNDRQLVAKGISASLLKEHCTNMRAQKQLVVIDACQAGGAVETFAMRGAAEQKAMAQLARATGVVILAATGTEQFATEFKQLGHGVFTYALLQGLEGEADGSPKDGKVTVAELRAYLDDQIPELTKKYRGQAQYPVAYSRGNDFPVSAGR